MPQTPRRERFHPTIRVFVSSTFSDLVDERNALQERVWPELERHCLRHGFQFQAIDLRWGVPTEAALDHRTMRICFDELRRAQEVSPRPNFLILLGDRYGWQPLPEEITPAEFGALQEAAASNTQHLKILADWYRLDTNAIPAVRVLRSRRESPDGRDYTKADDGRDTAAWVDVQYVLWSLINRAFPPSLLAGRFKNPMDASSTMPPAARFQGSATEQEIWRGAVSVADAARHVVAFSRDIGNLEAAAGHPKLREVVNVDRSGRLDDTLHEAIRALKWRLRETLGDNYVQAPEPARVRVVADAAGTPALEISTGQLEFLCNQVRDRLLPIIQQQIDDYQRLPDQSDATSLPAEDLRDLQREREHHARFAAERAPAGAFVGRRDEKTRILEYLDSGGGRPFVVHGASGSGKSALMAAASREAAERSGAILVERFLGTTQRSSDLRSLLIDLCQSLRERFPVAEELPTDIRLMEKEFYEQLDRATTDKPVYVFLDALDQLDPAEDAHSLWWIRSMSLPPHARIVLSCLSDPDDEAASQPWAALKRRGFIDTDHSLAVEHLDSQEAKLLWTRWLNQAGRGLTAEQQAAIDERVLRDAACRQPLYLRILFEEARRWPSYEPPPLLGAVVSDLLRSLFERLSQPAVHGPLVEPALGYLVSSRYGLSETELLEVLLRDPEYKPRLLASAQHALPRHARRIPIAVWSRLRYDLAPYLSERGAPGGSVLSFYHRQVANAARERFARTPARRHQWHRRLALYFVRQPWWLEPRSKQRERMQPPYSARPPHVRKITELPDQLLAQAREAKAAGFETDTEQAMGWIEQLFQKLSFLEAKNEAGRVFELAADFSRALEVLPESGPQRRMKLLNEALRRDIHFIARHAQDYPQGLFQCLWNHGWWYDCDDAATHYEDGRPPGLRLTATEKEAGAARGAEAVADDRLSRFLERWRNRKERGTPGFAWLRSHRPAPIHLGTAQLAVLQGHDHDVRSVSYSPDGRRIISGSRDGTVRVWDAESGANLAVLRGHEKSVQSVAYSPDGGRIVSASRDCTVRLWDAQKGAELAVLRGHGGWFFGDAGGVYSVSYSPDGRRIVSSGADATVRVWDAESGANLAVLRGHERGVGSVAYSPDGRRIVSGSVDSPPLLWDAESGAELAVRWGHFGATSVSYSPDGGRIVSSGDGTVWVSDAESGATLVFLHGHQGLGRVSYRPDGGRIVTACGDRTVRVWDADSGAELAVLRGHDDPVESVSYSPDGRRIISGSKDGTVRVWNAEGGAELAVLREHELLIGRVLYSPDGRRIATASNDQTVRVWDAQSGAELAVLRGHEGRTSPRGVSYRPDGGRIVSGSWDGTVRVWDADSGAELAVLRGHDNGVEGVAYSPDGCRIVSGSLDGTVRVWDADSGTELAVLRHEGTVKSVSYRQDGRRIVSGSADRTVRVWDADSGTELAVLRGHDDEVGSVSYSSDGRRIISGSSDETVRVWDADRGAELAVLRGHEGGVESVAYSPDGCRIVSCVCRYRPVFGVREVRVWNAESGECLEVIQGARDVHAIAAEAARLPWRVLAREHGTVIEEAETGTPVAWFPIYLGGYVDRTATHPSGRMWAGEVGRHLCIISLEG